MSKFAALNRRYLRISKNTTLEVRIYLHPDLIPSFTDDLLKVLLPQLLAMGSLFTCVETHYVCSTTYYPEIEGRKCEKER